MGKRDKTCTNSNDTRITEVHALIGRALTSDIMHGFMSNAYHDLINLDIYNDNTKMIYGTHVDETLDIVKAYVDVQERFA